MDAKLSFFGSDWPCSGVGLPFLELTESFGPKSGRKATGRSMAPRALGRVMLGGCGKSGGGRTVAARGGLLAGHSAADDVALGVAAAEGEAGHRHGVVGAAEEVAGAVADGVQASMGAPSAFSTCMSLFTFTP